MTTALDRTRALLNTPPPEPIPGQLDLTRSEPMTETARPCQPTTVLCGDMYCLDRDCDHESSTEGAVDTTGGPYCDEVREETVCATHSRFVAAEDGFDELVESAPWPCSTP